MDARPANEANCPHSAGPHPRNSRARTFCLCLCLFVCMCCVCTGDPPRVEVVEVVHNATD